MRVLIVARPGTGGAARVLAALLRRLPAAGVSGTAALSGLEGTELLDLARAHGWTTERLDLDRMPRPADVAAMRRIAALAKGHDLLHAHAAKAGGLARLGDHGVPVLYAPHGFYFTYHAPGSLRARLWRALERKLVPATAGFHAVSEEEAALCVRDLGAAAPRVHTIPNPVPPRVPDPAVRWPEGAGPCVLMAARLAEPKDPVGFFAAAHHVPESLRARFVLCGEGPLDKEARRGASRAPGGRAWVLAGVRDVRGLLRGTRCAVLATGSEAMPLYLLEALAEGVPAVATDLPGCRAASGDAALYVPAGDPAALGAAITQLCTDDALHARLAAAARARAPQFGEDRWLERVLAAYRATAQGG